MVGIGRAFNDKKLKNVFSTAWIFKPLREPILPITIKVRSVMWKIYQNCNSSLGLSVSGLFLWEQGHAQLGVSGVHLTTIKCVMKIFFCKIYIYYFFQFLWIILTNGVVMHGAVKYWSLNNSTHKVRNIMQLKN